MSKIYTKVSSKSWSMIPKEKACQYLDYYPKNTKEFIFKFLKTCAPPHSTKPNILDICCGNGVNYAILRNHFEDFKYQGIDCSPNLVEESLKKAGGDTRASFEVADCYEYLDGHKGRYDMTILFHIIECTESPDFLLGETLSVSKYVAIGWYDPPADRYDTSELMPTTYPEDIESAPYIRRKISIEYYRMLLDKHNARIVESYGEGKNRVDILTRK